MRRHFPGQGAIESNCDSTAGTLRAQGATEYLMLLATVLIIALVSIALLGFFPATSSDTAMTQSQIYWKSATPLAITELQGATWNSSNGVIAPISLFNMIITNTGSYPISIDAIVDKAAIENNYSVITKYAPDDFDINGWTYTPMNTFTIYPGESVCIGYNSDLLRRVGWQGVPEVSTCHKTVVYSVNASVLTFPYMLYTPSLCSAEGTGTMTIEGFGFRYTEYVEGNPVQKIFMGSKPLIVKCISSGGFS
ncbi:MAG: hypothetical protein NT051_04805 [Candidatus Micrarchaeota archaeon]|nr:hypothetical protein [Candidatus Micrarchaeota archaeon]